MYEMYHCHFSSAWCRYSHYDVITIFLSFLTLEQIDFLRTPLAKQSHLSKNLLNHNNFDTSRISHKQFGPPILILIVY